MKYKPYRRIRNKNNLTEQNKEEAMKTNIDLKKLGIVKCPYCEEYFNIESQKNIEGLCKSYLKSYCVKCLNDPLFTNKSKVCYNCDYCKLLDIKQCERCMKEYNKYDLSKTHCNNTNKNLCIKCKEVADIWCGNCDNCGIAICNEEIMKCELCGIFKSDGECTDKCDLCGIVKCYKCDKKIINSYKILNEAKNILENIGMKIEYYVCNCISECTEIENKSTLSKPGSFTKAALKQVIKVEVEVDRRKELIDEKLKEDDSFCPKCGKTVKEENITFYKKINWRLFVGSIKVCNKPFDHYLFYYNTQLIGNHIILNKKYL